MGGSGYRFSAAASKQQQQKLERGRGRPQTRLVANKTKKRENIITVLYILGKYSTYSTAYVVWCLVAWSLYRLKREINNTHQTHQLRARLPPVASQSDPLEAKKVRESTLSCLNCQPSLTGLGAVIISTGQTRLE